MAKRLKIVESEDRISSLPDSILRHILSFLPTKIGLSTCILSTRWRYLFPFTKNMYFDESLPYDQTSQLLDFVDRYMMLMNSTHLDRFCFECLHDINTSCVNSWFYAASLHNVRELDLCTNVSLFVPGSVYFPHLQTLHLDSIIFSDDVSIKRLVSGCPVLEELIIVECHMENIPLLNLYSRSLKRLTIDRTRHEHGYNLVLDAPSLEYLKFTICRRSSFTLKNLHSLSEAHVSISSLLGYRIVLPELFEQMGNVQSLYLTGDIGKFLQITSDELPLLKNLTRLVLTFYRSMQLPEAIKLLKCCPNLEEFVYHGTILGGYDLPSCQLTRLKDIKCTLLHDVVDDVESLEFFLKNANMLEKMQIHIGYIGKSRQHASEELEMMMERLNEVAMSPGRSKACQIEAS